MIQKQVLMKLFNILLLSVLFFGCSKNMSEEVNEQENRVEIRFRSDIRELQHDSYARSNFNDGAVIYLYISERTDVDIPMVPASEDKNEMICDNSGNLSFKDGLTHNYPENPIDVYGYFCKRTHPDPLDLTKIEVSVNADQSTTESLAESDFLYVVAPNGYAKDAQPIELEFKHLFSKLVINFITTMPNIIDLDQIEEVKVNNVVTTGVFDLGTGVLTNGEGIDEIQMGTGLTTSAIILPQTIKNSGVSVSVKFKNNDDVFEAVIPAECFEEGKKYTYDFQIDEFPGLGPVQQLFLVSIKNWDSVPSEVIVVEHGEKATVTLTDIARGVEINKTDLYLTSGDVQRKVKDIAVVNNKMEFIFPRTVEGGTLQLDSAYFYTIDGEKFAYHFKNVTLKGNNYDKVALTVPQVGDAWAGGTIFVVGEVTGYNENDNMFTTNTTGINAYKGRIVSNISFKNLNWCISSAKGAKKLVNMNDLNDGNKNLKVLLEFIKSNGETLLNYPAFNILEDGWYLPAINEIKSIVANRQNLNLNIQNQNGNLIEDVVYVSSTERGKDRESDICCTSVQGFEDKAILYNIRVVRSY